MGQKVCKEYMIRAYRNVHAKSGGPTLQQRVEEAKAKVDTGLNYSDGFANRRGSPSAKTHRRNSSIEIQGPAASSNEIKAEMLIKDIITQLKSVKQ